MPASLGQFNTNATIKITTRLNRAVTGLTDVLIDIYGPSGTKVVDNGNMDELGTTGIYQYSYNAGDIEGTYTVVITCASQRNYDELQTFQIGHPGGGGLSLTGDMVFDLKKLADNSVTKKEIKELIEKLAQITLDKEDEDKKRKKIEESISKMEDYVNSEKSNIDRLNQGLSKLQQEINGKLGKLSSSLGNMEQVSKEHNANIAGKIIELDTRKDVSKLHERLEEIESREEAGISKLQENISKIGEHLKNLPVQSEQLQVMAEKIINLSTQASMQTSKFQEDEKETKEKVISKFNETFEYLAKVSKFTEAVCNFMEESYGKLLEPRKVELVLSQKYDTLVEAAALQVDSGSKAYIRYNGFLEEIKKEIIEMKDKVQKEMAGLSEIKGKIGDSEINRENDSTKLMNLLKSVEGIKIKLKEFESKALSSRDLNMVSVDLTDKINSVEKEIFDMKTTLKNKLIQLHKDTSKDDLPEVISQMELLNKR